MSAQSKKVKPPMRDMDRGATFNENDIDKGKMEKNGSQMAIV